MIVSFGTLGCLLSERVLGKSSFLCLEKKSLFQWFLDSQRGHVQILLGIDEIYHYFYWQQNANNIT